MTPYFFESIARDELANAGVGTVSGKDHPGVVTGLLGLLR